LETPEGAAFYPIYSTARAEGVQCLWHFGDTQILNTTDLFGGDSTIEYGALLETFFPGLGFRFENFRSAVTDNPCPYALKGSAQRSHSSPSDSARGDTYRRDFDGRGGGKSGERRPPVSEANGNADALTDILVGAVPQIEFGAGRDDQRILNGWYQ